MYRSTTHTAKADTGLAHTRSEVATVEIAHNSTTDGRIVISTPSGHAFQSRHGSWQISAEEQTQQKEPPHLKRIEIVRGAEED